MKEPASPFSPLQMTISKQDRLTIANSLIKASPPGEINDVFNGNLVPLHPLYFIDVKTLLQNDSLLHSTITDTFQSYNTDNYVTAVPPGQDYSVRNI